MHALQESHNHLQILIKSLQVKEDAEAIEILRQLRQGTGVETIVNHLRAGDLLVHIHTTPESRVSYEFPYRAQMPRVLLTPSNPYVTSLMYTTIYSGSSTTTSDSPSESQDDMDYNMKESPYLKPYALAELVDSRLDNVSPSKWTAVISDDAFLRMLLKLYFQFEHHFYSCFHKDLFLDDMMAGETNFCSELLVNAVLALACVGHRLSALPSNSHKRIGTCLLTNCFDRIAVELSMVDTSFGTQTG